MTIRYKIAETAEDEAEAHKLIAECGFDRQDFMFPSIMAWEGVDLVGFIATARRSDMVLCGPLAMKPDKRRVFTAIKLVTLYESVMKSLGMQSIVFTADENDSVIVRGLRKWFPHIEPYGKIGSSLLYNWRLK